LAAISNPSPAAKAGIAWAKIPGGSFVMGTNDWEFAKPRHQVAVRTFYMAKTEVTAGQYQACVDAGACTAPGTGGYCNWGVSGREQHPINCVDWDQARAFSQWVGGRLPSEAEWEYAARSAGQERQYPWGDEPAACARAVLDDGGNGCGKNSTWPVCSKPKGNTEQGLCDMAGNVWEWAQDWYHGSYHGAPTDGGAWESPAGSSRVIRGGSWYFVAGFARSAGRYSDVPGVRRGYLGFRPARSR
jgi:formylglycine-generating enzyme required for sulfatase activity